MTNKPMLSVEQDPVAWAVEISGCLKFFEQKKSAENARRRYEKVMDAERIEPFPLFAEQPVTVADHTQCEECKGWGYHENHHEGGGTECGACGGSGNATVAVAVVMPECESFDISDWAGSFCQEALSFGVNEDSFARCIRTTIIRTLAEVVRLNGVKP